MGRGAKTQREEMKSPRCHEPTGPTPTSGLSLVAPAFLWTLATEGSFLPPRCVLCGALQG